MGVRTWVWVCLYLRAKDPIGWNVPDCGARGGMRWRFRGEQGRAGASRALRTSGGADQRFERRSDSRAAFASGPPSVRVNSLSPLTDGIPPQMLSQLPSLWKSRSRPRKLTARITGPPRQSHRMARLIVGRSLDEAILGELARSPRTPGGIDAG
jgi:hypothetical protein